MIRTLRHRSLVLPRALAWLVVAWLGMAALLAGFSGEAIAHTPHVHCAHDDVSAMMSATHDMLRDVEHGHDHSGDPIQDLLKLGHHHVGCPSLGLPPSLVLHVLVLPPADPGFQPRGPAIDDDLPDSLFRPPIV